MQATKGPGRIVPLGSIQKVMREFVTDAVEIRLVQTRAISNISFSDKELVSRARIGDHPA
jgi:hypothetical protein